MRVGFRDWPVAEFAGQTALAYNTQYYFKVRYQDNYNNWSSYSTGTYFTTVANQVPNTPTNSTPANTATNQSINTSLTSSAFSDPDGGDTHSNSQWQVATDSGFTSIVWDSGTTATNKTSVVINTTNGTFSGALSGWTRLEYSTRYYFRVRYQDNYNNWSSYSSGTYYDTLANSAPNTPTNSTPANTATNQAVNTSLTSSAFSDSNAGDTHANSQWQVATDSGFTAIVWDSGTTASNKTSVTINGSNGTFSGSLAGKSKLNYSTRYYFRVRYQDNYNNWSSYSSGTYYDTVANTAPVTPTNSTPTNASTGQSRNSTLTSSVFSDANGDTHSNSQWQVATDSGFTAIVWDSGTTATNKTSVVVNSTNGTFQGSLNGWTALEYGTQYYFRVRYQDDYTAWSSYSTGTYFTTVANQAPNTPTNSTPANTATNQAVNTALTSSAFSDPDGGDTHSNSQWQVATDSGFTSIVWDSGTTATNKTSVTINTTNGTFSGSLSGKTKLNYSIRYYFRVRYQDNYNNWSSYSSGTYYDTVANTAPATPTNSTPANASTNQSRNPTLTSSAFSDSNGDAHSNSQWRIATDSGFTAIVWDSGTTSANKTSVVVNTTNGTFSGALSGQSQLASSTQYYFQVRYQDDYTAWSSYSTETYFTTQANAAPNTPTNSTPTNTATNQAVNTTLTSSVFSDPDAGNTHGNSQWQIATDSGFTSVVWDSGTTASNLTSVAINTTNGTFSGGLAGKSKLNYSTRYYFHVRYQDNFGTWSSYSSGTYYDTVANTAPVTPTNSTPANTATNQSRNPTLTSSVFSDANGDTHANSQWQVATDSGFTSIVWDSGTTATNKTSVVVNTSNGTFQGALNGQSALAYGTQYYFRVRYQDDYTAWSSYSTGTYFTTTANQPPNTPTNSTPANAATGQSRNPTLTSSAFSDPDAGDIHSNSQWQISTNSGFTAIVWDSGTTSTNKTSVVVNTTNGTFQGSLNGWTTLEYGTQYYFRVRHQDNSTNWSNYSSNTYFTTIANQTPNTPTNSTPTNGATGQNINTPLTSSAFSDPDAGDTHSNSQWQVATDSGFTSVVWDSGTTATNKTSITVNTSNGTFQGALNGQSALAYSTTYYVRVRYQDNYNNWSSYSTGTNFQTQLTPYLTQNFYRWYSNTDSTNVTDPYPLGGSDLAENAAITAANTPPASGTVLRLRISIQDTATQLNASTQAFKLQYAQAVGSCGGGDESWSDVGAPGSGIIWRGYDNGIPPDGTTLASTKLSVSDTMQTYEENNPTVANVNAIAVGDDGEWDFTLENNGATENTAYCFQLVRSGGNSLDSYNNYPRLITASGSVITPANAVYKLDEGLSSTTNNSGAIGSTINGTFDSNSPTWTNNGKYGKAISLSGTRTESVIISNNITAGVSNAGDFSLSMWFNCGGQGYGSDNPQLAGLFIHGTSAENGTGGFYLRQNSTSCAALQFTVGTTTAYQMIGGNTTTTQGNWNHLVALKQGDTLKLYENGNQIASQTFAGSNWKVNPDLLSQIGNVHGRSIKGLIDEVKFFSYALTDDQIKVDYNRGSARVMGASSTTSDGTTPSSSAARSYCVPGDTSACNSPILEWKLDEGSGISALDTSGSNHTGTLSSASWSSGKINRGITSNISTPDIDDLSSTSFTLSYWFKWNIAQSGWPRIGKLNSANPDANNEYSFQYAQSDGRWYFRANNSAVLYAQTSGQSLDTTVGTWHFISISYDSSTGKLLIVQNGSRTLLNVTNSFTITNSAFPFVSTGGSNITVDNVQFYNYARTPAQMAWDYNQGGPQAYWKLNECTGSNIHDLAGTNNGTLNMAALGQTSAGDCSTNASTAWYNGRTGKYNGSLKFDGQDDNVSVPDFYTGTNQLTVGGWVKFTNRTAQLYNSLVAKQNEYVFYVPGSSDNFAFYIYGQTSDCLTTDSYPNLANDYWYHFTGVYNGNTQTKDIYINGSKVATKACNGGVLDNTVNPLYIGGAVFGSTYWTNGQIDDVRVYNYALTPAQIKTMMSLDSVVRYGP